MHGFQLSKLLPDPAHPFDIYGYFPIILQPLVASFSLWFWSLHVRVVISERYQVSGQSPEP